MSNEISAGRQFFYYLGGALQIVGVLLFLSCFFSFFMFFANITGLFTGSSRPFAVGDGFSGIFAGFVRAFIGFFIALVGKIIQGIGAKGLAGSGVVLNPEQARQDLEPYSRMAGGMVKDALEETGLAHPNNQPEKIIMIKCQFCGHLNAEDAIFCQQCGKKL